jgi:hypothetical protein
MSGWIEYGSNNSGGSFWLKDEDWKALAEAGWTVDWFYTATTKYGVLPQSGRRYGDTWEEATRERVPGEPEWPNSKTPGDSTVHKIARTYDEAVALREKHGGYFNTLAVSAVKQGANAAELVAEFERITGQIASDEGCNCCGPPHSFTWHDEDGSKSYASAQVTKTQLVWS